MSRRALTILALALALASEGCTLIGLGIGAASPKYEEFAAASPPSSGASAQGNEATRRGENEPQPPPSGGAPRVQRRIGSYRVEGLVIGATFDAFVITMVAVVAASYHPSGSLTGGFQQSAHDGGSWSSSPRSRP